MKQLITFFALAYGISWLIWLPLYAPALNIPVFKYQHALGGLGPFIAAVITLLVYKQRLPSTAINPFKPFVLKYIAIALFSPFILLITAKAINFIVNKNPIEFNTFKSDEFPEFNFILFFIYNFIAFGIGEEFGWRGFALPRTQSKYSAFISSIIITLFWAIWHWPAFLYRTGYTTMDIGGIVGWLLSLLTGSILLTWLYNSTKGNILAVAIFHTTIDIAFTMDTNATIMQYMGILITVWGISIVFIFKPKNLSNNERVKA